MIGLAVGRNPLAMINIFNGGGESSARRPLKSEVVGQEEVGVWGVWRR